MAAAGGYGRGLGVPLAQRVRPDAAAPAEPMPSPARHCRVDGRMPGLLTEWRREDGGWVARIVVVRWVDGEGWCTVTAWVRADRVTPCDCCG